jgi:hypothetical protein
MCEKNRENENNMSKNLPGGKPNPTYICSCNPAYITTTCLYRGVWEIKVEEVL